MMIQFLATVLAVLLALLLWELIKGVFLYLPAALWKVRQNNSKSESDR